MRPVLFTILFYGWTILAGLAALPLLLGPPAPLRAYSRIWVRVTLWLLRIAVGLSHRVVGRENIPAIPALFAIKHQSAWETLAINLIIRDPAIVLKRELTRIPIFGWFLIRTDQIAIDRSGGMSALRSMVSAARGALADGRSIVIYPEGTRVAPGSRMPYHGGIAALHGALDVPVVPVAVNSGMFWPRRMLGLRPGVITIEFLPPLPPDLSRRDFTETLETTIEAAAGRLYLETAATTAHPNS
ncbi:MAG: lysophospholipid acyltransferase family protein [Proteobacteria bacterium]|nr:lysophospholipid acyltransferase family protein [Pseudomonadota bacterium]